MTDRLTEYDKMKKAARDDRVDSAGRDAFLKAVNAEPFKSKWRALGHPVFTFLGHDRLDIEPAAKSYNFTLNHGKELSVAFSISADGKLLSEHAVCRFAVGTEKYAYERKVLESAAALLVQGCERGTLLLRKCRVTQSNGNEAGHFPGHISVNI